MRQQACSAAGGLAVALLSPLSIFAPKWFARQFATHPLMVPLLVASLLAAMWLAVRMDSTRFAAAMLLLGALALVGMWAICTMLTLSLAGRWEESEKASSYKSGSLVFSFAGGFCLLLLMLYWFGTDLVDMALLPHLKRSISLMVGYRMSLLVFGLVLSVLAPIQIFRGLTSVGGGAMPALEPLCCACGYSLAGVAASYRAHRPAGGEGPAGPAVCSECGAALAISLEPGARPGTAWTRGESLSVAAWMATLGQVLRRPSEFFARLPLGSSRGAAVRFWAYNLLGVLAFVASCFVVNHFIYMHHRLAMPVPIALYEPANMSGGVTMAIWLPATLIGATTVMYTIVMAGMLTLCFSAQFVWRPVTALRGQNMHPAGLLMVCYLSGHVFAVLTIATVAFLAGRLVVLLIPPDQALIGWLTYDRIMELRMYAGGAAVGAGLVAAALGALWLRPVVTRATKAMQYGNF